MLMPVFFLFVVSALISWRDLPRQSYRYTISSLISIFLSRFFFTTLDGVSPPSLPSAKMFPDTHLPVLGAKTLPDGREEIKEIQQHGFFKKISIFPKMEFQVDFEMLWY
jgi:hypothetical protein